MNYGGNMPDWHQYNPGQPTAPEVTTTSQNVNPGHLFNSGVDQRALGLNLSSEGLAKGQTETNYSPRNFQGSPSALNPHNGSEGSMHQMHGSCVGPYGPSTSRNPMMEGLNVPVGTINEAIAHRNNQVPLNHTMGHMSGANIGAGSTLTSMGTRNPGINAVPSRQAPYVPCKGPCCNPEPNVGYQAWEKFGPYQPNLYRDNIGPTGYSSDNRRFGNEFNYRKNGFENKDTLGTTFTIDPRRSFPDYKYRKDSVVPRGYPPPHSALPNYPVQNYNFPTDYQKYPYNIKDYPRENGMNTQNPAILKYQEQSVIVQQKYTTKQIQYQNGGGALQKNIMNTPNVGTNVMPRNQNPYFNPQLPRDLTREFPRDYRESTDPNLVSNRMPNATPIHGNYPKYQVYQQKIAMQRYSMENHLRELTRIPGYQTHPKYQECVLRYRELLRLQQTVDYQSTVQESSPRLVSTPVSEEIPPINLQFDQNGVLINSSYLPTAFSANASNPINAGNSVSANEQVPSNSDTDAHNLQRSSENFANPPEHKKPIQQESLRHRDTFSVQKDFEQTDEKQQTEQQYQEHRFGSKSFHVISTRTNEEVSSVQQSNSKNFANKPELDVRQFLANWDESEDEESCSENVTDVILNTVTPVVVVGYEDTKVIEKSPEVLQNLEDAACSKEDFDVNQNEMDSAKIEEPSETQVAECHVISDCTNIVNVVNNVDGVDDTPKVSEIIKDPGRTGSVIHCITDAIDNVPTIHIVENLDNDDTVERIVDAFENLTSPVTEEIHQEVEKLAIEDVTQARIVVDEKSEKESHEESTELTKSLEELNEDSCYSDSSSNTNFPKSSTDIQEASERRGSTDEMSSLSTSEKDVCDNNSNLRKQNSFTSEESHNPDDISLPDLPTSECTPISTTLNTPIHSDSEDSSSHVVDLTIPTNPIEIIQNSPMISFTHSPVKIEPYGHLDQRRLTQKESHESSLDFDFEGEEEPSDTLENNVNSSKDHFDMVDQISSEIKESTITQELEPEETSSNSKNDSIDKKMSQSSISIKESNEESTYTQKIVKNSNSEVEEKVHSNLLKREKVYTESRAILNQNDFTATGAMIPLIPGEEFEEPKMPVPPMEGNCLTKIMKNTMPITDLDVLGSDEENLDDMDDIWMEVESIDKSLDGNLTAEFTVRKSSGREDSCTKKLMKVKKSGWRSSKCWKNSNDVRRSVKKNLKANEKSSNEYSKCSETTLDATSYSASDSTFSTLKPEEDVALIRVTEDEDVKPNEIKEINTAVKLKCAQVSMSNKIDSKCYSKEVREGLKRVDNKEKGNFINDIATKLLENAKFFEPELQGTDQLTKDSKSLSNSKDSNKERIQLLKEFRKPKNKTVQDEAKIQVSQEPAKNPETRLTQVPDKFEAFEESPEDLSLKTHIESGSFHVKESCANETTKQNEEIPLVSRVQNDFNNEIKDETYLKMNSKAPEEISKRTQEQCLVIEVLKENFINPCNLEEKTLSLQETSTESTKKIETTSLDDEIGNLDKIKEPLSKDSIKERIDIKEVEPNVKSALVTETKELGNVQDNLEENISLNLFEREKSEVRKDTTNALQEMKINESSLVLNSNVLDMNTQNIVESKNVDNNSETTPFSSSLEKEVMDKDKSNSIRNSEETAKNPESIIHSVNPSKIPKIKDTLFSQIHEPASSSNLLDSTTILRSPHQLNDFRNKSFDEIDLEPCRIETNKEPENAVSKSTFDFDFDNFDVAPNDNDQEEVPQQSWRCSKSNFRFEEDCEKYKNPDSYVNPIFTNLDALENLNTVPVYTTKDGKITYSPNPKFTYRTLIMEARAREGYLQPCYSYYGKSSSKYHQYDYREKFKESHSKRRHEDYRRRRQRSNSEKTESHGESLIKYSDKNLRRKSYSRAFECDRDKSDRVLDNFLNYSIAEQMHKRYSIESDSLGNTVDYNKQSTSDSQLRHKDILEMLMEPRMLSMRPLQSKEDKTEYDNMDFEPYCDVKSKYLEKDKLSDSYYPDEDSNFDGISVRTRQLHDTASTSRDHKTVKNCELELEIFTEDFPATKKSDIIFQSSTSWWKERRRRGTLERNLINVKRNSNPEDDEDIFKLEEVKTDNSETFDLEKTTKTLEDPKELKPTLPSNLTDISLEKRKDFILRDIQYHDAKSSDILEGLQEKDILQLPKVDEVVHESNFVSERIKDTISEAKTLEIPTDVIDVCKEDEVKNCKHEGKNFKISKESVQKTCITQDKQVSEKIKVQSNLESTTRITSNFTEIENNFIMDSVVPEVNEFKGSVQPVNSKKIITSKEEISTEDHKVQKILETVKNLVKCVSPCKDLSEGTAIDSESDSKKTDSTIVVDSVENLKVSIQSLTEEKSEVVMQDCTYKAVVEEETFVPSKLQVPICDTKSTTEETLSQSKDISHEKSHNMIPGDCASVENVPELQKVQVEEEQETRCYTENNKKIEFSESMKTAEGCQKLDGAPQFSSEPSIKNYTTFSSAVQDTEESLKTIPKLLIKKTEGLKSTGKLSKISSEQDPKLTSSVDTSTIIEKESTTSRVTSYRKIPKMIIRNARSRPSTPTIEAITPEQKPPSQKTLKDEQKTFKVKIKNEDFEKNVSESKKDVNSLDIKIPIMKIKVEEKLPKILIEKSSNEELDNRKIVPKMKITKVRSAVPKIVDDTELPSSSTTVLKRSKSLEVKSSAGEVNPSVMSVNLNPEKIKRSHGAEGDQPREKIPKLKIRKNPENSISANTEVQKKRHSSVNSPVHVQSKKLKKNAKEESKRSIKVDEAEKKSSECSSTVENKISPSILKLVSEKIPKVIIKRASPSAEFKCELSKDRKDAIIKNKRWQPKVKLQRSWVLDCMAKELRHKKVSLKLSMPKSNRTSSQRTKPGPKRTIHWRRHSTQIHQHSKLIRSNSTSDLIPLNKIKSRRMSDCDFTKLNILDKGIRNFSHSKLSQHNIKGENFNVHKSSDNTEDCKSVSSSSNLEVSLSYKEKTSGDNKSTLLHHCKELKFQQMNEKDQIGQKLDESMSSKSELPVVCNFSNFIKDLKGSFVLNTKNKDTKIDDKSAEESLKKLETIMTKKEDSQDSMNLVDEETKIKEEEEIQYDDTESEDLLENNETLSENITPNSLLYNNCDLNSIIKVESSDESQTTIDILPASPDITPGEVEIHTSLENEENERLYSEDAIPTQFELELEIADNNVSDPLDVPIPDSQDLTDHRFTECLNNGKQTKIRRQSGSNLKSMTERSTKDPKDPYSTRRSHEEPTSSSSFNVHSKSRSSKLHSVSKRNRRGEEDARILSSKIEKSFCCSDLLVKEVLAAKEALRKCLAKSKSETNKSKLKARPKTAAEKKQGSCFDLSILMAGRSSTKYLDDSKSLESRDTKVVQTTNNSRVKTEAKTNSDKNEKKHSKQVQSHSAVKKLNSRPPSNLEVDKKEPVQVELQSQQEFSYSSNVNVNSRVPIVPIQDSSTISLKSTKLLTQFVCRDSRSTKEIPETHKSKETLEKFDSLETVRETIDSSQTIKPNALKNGVKWNQQGVNNIKSYKIPKISKTQDPSVDNVVENIPKDSKMPVLEPEMDMNFETNSNRSDSRSPPVITNQEVIIRPENPENFEEKDNKQSNEDSLLIQRASVITVADIVNELAYHEKATIRHRRYCTLCERWFPTAARHRRHLTGYQHRHTELIQRRTVHALFMLFTGSPCSRLQPANVVRTDCLPGEPTPLQIAVQDVATGLDRIDTSLRDVKKQNEEKKS
ncbi:uncharacterized protein LOC107268829 [Cephus cinctus]|uniref:Uncharacterized protein LOC107268829 n=1 Tax=Cephus cinctus TaxID=211228 RepID=A0AAJ7FLA9_CEPCN|nr:uncharacterized protein LOC107268829 [Cephus cinctus]XP_015597463.1 uncharacterized protein LOC107268829 [Cephus cinctus]